MAGRFFCCLIKVYEKPKLLGLVGRATNVVEIETLSFGEVGDEEGGSRMRFFGGTMTSGRIQEGE